MDSLFLTLIRFAQLTLSLLVCSSLTLLGFGQRGLGVFVI